MNRELRFRAWDGRTLSRPFLLSELKAEVWLEGDPDESLEVSVPDCALPLSGDLLLEQWTGLRDKNKREIYEGDIIMAPHWWWGPCAVEYKVGQVGPCKADNVMEWRLSKCHNLWNGAEVEVIGNIHENFDLLEEK